MSIFSLFKKKQTLSVSIDAAKLPRHVAIIMDGNGRWAKERGLPRVEGHRNGSKSLRKVIETSRRLGIRYLTVYAFSSENWNRPAAEVSALMKLLENAIQTEAEELIKNGVRVRVMGDRTRLPENVNLALKKLEEDSAHCDGLDFIMALSYGGRDEITKATKKIAQQVLDKALSVDDIDEKCLSANMYLSDVPDPDLMIRTSGECRISNFLLWQIAYSEIVITKKYWPDFDEAEFMNCLDEYTRRHRRFGKTEEQIKAG